MLETGLNHKPYIDGLRAVAVLAVILFHLHPTFLLGGYLGVDIFFVISGFVISQSLYKDYCQNGRIYIFEFYKRRFKRLYPALLVMIAITTLGYVLFGFLWDTNLFIKSGIFSILAVSNLYFLKHGDDYFAQDLINPLLHTWSLGVEEQFYFLYPFLLALGLSAITKRNLSLKWLTWSIALVSVALYLVFAFRLHDIFSNFYFPTARFWELGAGCALFFLTQNIRVFDHAKSIALLSAGMLFFVIVFQSHIDNLYIETLCAVIGTLGIIYAGIGSSSSFIVRFLQNKMATFVGKLSYSLYLWHLPVIYFANLYLTGLAFYVAATLLTVLAAVCSYYFVEKPLRYSSILDRGLKFVPWTGGAVLVLTLIVVAQIGLTDLKKFINMSLNKLDSELAIINYVESNFSLGKRIQPNYAIDGNNVELNCGASVSIGSSAIKGECFKRTDTSRVIFLTGDSHAMHFVPMIDNSEIISNFYYRTFDRGSIAGTIADKDRQVQEDRITERLKELDELSKEFEEVYYITSLFLDQKQYQSDEIEKNLNNYVQMIDPSIQVIFIAPTPVFATGPESCVILGKHCEIQKSEDLKRVSEVTSIYNSLVLKYGNVHVYNPYEALCPESKCSIYNKESDFLLYRDDDHLSVEGSESLSSHFDAWFKDEFARSLN